MSAADTLIIHGSQDAASIRSVRAVELFSDELLPVAMDGGIVFAQAASAPISPTLWMAMLREFERNGGRTLSEGKVRFLRRRLRRQRS